MDLTPRVDKLLSHANCPPDCLSILADQINLLKHDIRQKQEDLAWAEAWLAFHQSKPTKWEYLGDFKLFEIDDGETHIVAARSATDALSHHAGHLGYQSIGDYKDEFEGYYSIRLLPANQATGVYQDVQTYPRLNLEVKTNAEWAEVTVPVTISTTDY